MGLDMYLYAKRYLADYNPADKAIKDEISDKLPSPYKGVKEIKSEIAYWRKANAIHKWFVDNCQDGVDECQESYVPLEKLSTLVELCKIVLADPSRASELLPTQGGFFFGSTDYDPGYVDDLVHTVQILEPLLQYNVVETLQEENGNWNFYYQSSW